MHLFIHDYLQLWLTKAAKTEEQHARKDIIALLREGDIDEQIFNTLALSLHPRNAVPPPPCSFRMHSSIPTPFIFFLNT